MLLVTDWVEGHGFYWSTKSQNLKTILENYIHMVFQSVFFFLSLWIFGDNYMFISDLCTNEYFLIVFDPPRLSVLCSTFYLKLSMIFGKNSESFSIIENSKFLAVFVQLVFGTIWRYLIPHLSISRQFKIRTVGGGSEFLTKQFHP